MCRIAERHSARTATISDEDGFEVTSVILGKGKAILGTNYPSYVSFVLYAGKRNVIELTSSDKRAKCIWTQVERFAERHSMKGRKKDGSDVDKGQR